MSKQLHHVVMRSHSAKTFIAFLTDVVGMEVQFELRVPGAGATGTEPKGAGALSIGVGKSLELTRTGPYLLLTGMKKQLHATTASR